LVGFGRSRAPRAPPQGKALFALKQFRKAALAYAKGLEVAVKNAEAADAAHARELEAVKKQAETQGSEYLRLLEENATLKRQLEDYELMFGDKKKYS